MNISKKEIKTLELLSPAANAEVAKAAIMHGADAVYIGATSHGARKSASNSIEDIKSVVDFAHQFRAKVYVTVNTIIYENELHSVEKLCMQLYKAGVDALIVQDMGLLRLDLPPIALHASTQCDIRTPEKAKFLEDVGFSQIVLARELGLEEIKRIVEAVKIPVECFVHGALCVSYSGRCHASCATMGRSANRGECAQLCRLPYTLRDSSGKIYAKDKHLLSLKDFNVGNSLQDLVKIGVRSFKIEGRLKDAGYVKNITANYNSILNRIVSDNPDKFRRTSFGTTEITFTPQPEKSFNRGFTDYFLTERRPKGIASLDTPKSMGEIVKDTNLLHNGDGISFFDEKGEYQGVNINKVENGRIIPSRKISIPPHAVIHRTNDIVWEKTLAGRTSERKISLDIYLEENSVTAVDERGVSVRLPLDVIRERAQKEMDYKGEFNKLGNTIYRLRNFHSTLDKLTFIPRSEISKIRRNLIDLLEYANLTTYPFEYRRKENIDAMYPYKELDYRDNVANSKAREFYHSHGVEKIEAAMEVAGGKAKRKSVVMTTRHCILRELGMCKKTSGKRFAEPLTIENSRNLFELRFNCKNCEMEVILP